LVEQLTCNQ